MTILEEAQKIIYGDREQTYGDPAKNLKNVAMLWNQYLALKQVRNYNACITAEDVCWMMVLLKMARQANQYKDDNLIDAAGYVALIERISK